MFSSADPAQASQPQWGASPAPAPAPAEGGAAAPGEQGGYQGNHPVAAFFHVFFKVVAFLVYLLGSVVFSANFVSLFITVALFHAADFWTTKNITGRLLVKLRWWNYVKEDGESEWVFESHPDASKVNSFDKHLFWITTYASVAVWALLSIFSVLSFSTLPLCLMGAAMTGTNAFCYTKCSREAKAKMTQMVLQNPTVMRAAVGAAVGS